MTALSSSSSTGTRIHFSDLPDATWSPTRTSSAVIPSYTGDPDYPVFPNPEFISRFFAVSSLEAGITNQDTDLYNRCYLPGNPLPYAPAPYNQSIPSSSTTSSKEGEESFRTRKRSWVSVTVEKPDYQASEAPCVRQGAINTNCYFQNTNGTFSGLHMYDGDFDQQQHCYCEKYPWWEAVMGCQKCFELHGGIEGYHYFPESFISALADAYCNANPIEKEFYAFVKEWKSTAKEAQVPSTTAKDLLGAQTAASLYFTAQAAVSSQKAKSEATGLQIVGKRRSAGLIVVGILVGSLLVGM